MRHSIIACPAGVLVLAGSLIQAADVSAPEDVASHVLYTHAGQSDVTDPDFPDQKGTVAIHELSVMAPCPLGRSETWQWFAGPFFERHQFEFENIAGVGDTTLYSAALLLGTVYAGLESWEFAASAAPGLYTDFHKTTGDDFKTLVYGAATRRLSSTVWLTAGAAYDTAFGKDEVYPVGGFRWDPDPALSLRLVFPEPAILWAPFPDLVLHTHLLPAGGKWNLRESGGERPEYDFKTESWRAGLGADFRLLGPLWLQVAGGLDFDRRYRIEKHGDSLMDSSVDDTWYVRTGVVLR